MSTFAVNGVRIDPLSARVTHVRWAAVNPADRSWAATPREERGREPHLYDVAENLLQRRLQGELQRGSQFSAVRFKHHL